MTVLTFTVILETFNESKEISRERDEYHKIFLVPLMRRFKDFIKILKEISENFH